MTCNDCLYYDVCQYHMTEETEMTVAECSHFNNKANFVEVVRCKDCNVPHNKWTGCPHLNGLIPPSDFYCAKGERTPQKALLGYGIAESEQA